MLTLTLLGQFRAQVTGQPDRLRFPTQKAVALLAYLAMHDHPRASRDALASLLWSDRPLAQGRHSLRQELTHIRSAIGAEAATYLYADRESVALHLDHVDVDAERLTELVARHTSDSMREACALYRGELLTGLRTREQTFDAWLDMARTDLRRLAIIAHEYRIDDLRRQGATAEALGVARRLLLIDATHDSAQRLISVLESDPASREQAAEQGPGEPLHDDPRNAMQAALTRPGTGRASSDPTGGKRRFGGE